MSIDEKLLNQKLAELISGQGEAWDTIVRILRPVVTTYIEGTYPVMDPHYFQALQYVGRAREALTTHLDGKIQAYQEHAAKGPTSLPDELERNMARRALADIEKGTFCYRGNTL